jgi:hypothetical protein
LDFARRLKGGDTILTFNYDTLLEKCLDAVGQPYRLFRERPDMLTDEVVLLKLHGSVDWFNSCQYADHVKVAEEFGYIAEDPIFGPKRIVDSIPLVDGERQPQDPLKAIFRVLDPSALYTNNYPLVTPHILAPSFTKIVYVGALKDLWYELGRMGSLEQGMAIIGFSLPAHDEYLRQTLYRLTRNYTHNNWPEVMPDRAKTRLRMVDLRSAGHPLAEFYARYGFIDWTKADVWFDGFSEASLDFIFNSTPASA